MYLVMVGCGKVGSAVANLLSRGMHNIVVIDKDSSAFELLDNAFNGITLLGNGIDVDVQKRAGVDKADAFVAVSGSDATNLMAAQVARRFYHVPKVVARVSDSDNETLYRYFGIDTISPTLWEAMEIRNLVLHDSLHRYLSVESAGLEIIRAKIKARAVGKTVTEVSSPGQLIISLIFRDDGAFIPIADTVFRHGDEVVAALSCNDLQKHRKWLEI